MPSYHEKSRGKTSTCGEGRPSNSPTQKVSQYNYLKQGFGYSEYLFKNIGPNTCNDPFRVFQWHGIVKGFRRIQLLKC